MTGFGHGRKQRALGRALIQYTSGEEHDYLRELIQVALPELNADDREFLISGFSPEGWDEIYGKEDE